MGLLPTTPRLLLGPGPSPVLPRVLNAMVAPQRSHLDPDRIALLDDIRRRLHGLFNVSDEGIGAGLGPLTGKIWLVGLMGAGATSENVQQLIAALKAEIG